MTQREPEQDVGSSKPAKTGKGGKGRRGRPEQAAESKKATPPESMRGSKVSAATYNTLQKAYFEQQSIERAANIAGVSWKTARYYIEGPAKPRLGMVPIRQAWLDVQAQAQERTQLTLLKFHQDQMKELTEIIDTNLAELRLIRAEVYRRVKKFRESKGEEIDTGSSMAGALRSYERAIKLMERMLGAPDLTLGSSDAAEERYKNWTDDEIVEFMLTGKVPDHAR